MREVAIAYIDPASVAHGEDDDPYLSTDEMRERLRALTPEQYRDLARRSRFLVRDQRMLAADLRQEAVVRALAGRRKCRQSWDVVAFLKGVMRSIIGDERRDEAEDRIPVLRDDLNEPALEDLLPVEQLALDAIDYRRTIASIEEALRLDPQLMALANAILGGKRGEALQRQLQVDADGLAALRRKLKRVNRRPKRTPYRRAKGTPSSSSVTGMRGAPFVLVAA